MDKSKLEELLQPFVSKCAEKGKPLMGIQIEEAFPGDSSTSYIVAVKGEWIDDISCSEALDFLIDALWETTDLETRRKVFYIKVLSSKDDFRLFSQFGQVAA